MSGSCGMHKKAESELTTFNQDNLFVSLKFNQAIVSKNNKSEFLGNKKILHNKDALHNSKYLKQKLLFQGT